MYLWRKQEPAFGFLAYRVDNGEVGTDGCDLASCYKFDKVHPVGADISNGSCFTRLLSAQSPAVVL